jgi:hypothetical protein
MGPAGHMSAGSGNAGGRDELIESLGVVTL